MSHTFNCITSTVPPIVTIIEPLPVVVDTDVELVCIVTGVDPPDTITWMFGGAVIYTGNEMTGGNFTQTISSDGYGVYICAASNEFGSSETMVEIIQAGINFEIIDHRTFMISACVWFL